MSLPVAGRVATPRGSPAHAGVRPAARESGMTGEQPALRCPVETSAPEYLGHRVPDPDRRERLRGAETRLARVHSYERSERM